MAMPLGLQDKTVVITGGASGLGFAIAEALGQAGAAVALNDLRSDRVERACAALTGQGIRCHCSVADVCDAAAVTSFVDAARRDLGVPDIVVANAGLYPNTPFLELGEDEWDQVMDTNVKGVFLTCQAAARVMVEARKAGQMVVVSSGAANRAIWGWSHYCVSKAAVLMLARAMALELGEYGIRVNAVLPGYIDVEEGGAHLADSYRQTARTSNPLGRAGTPTDVANAVMLLASSLAGYVSGAALVVDGGASTGPISVRPSGPPVNDP